MWLQKRNGKIVHIIVYVLTAFNHKPKETQGEEVKYLYKAEHAAAEEQPSGSSHGHCNKRL